MAERRNKEGKSWKFSARERRGILMLIPLLAVLGWILYSAAKPRFDGTAEIVGDAIAETTGAPGSHSDSALQGEQGTQTGTFRMAVFDPNTVTYEEMRGMGLDGNIAASLVRWREYGKVFNIPEDFALVNGMSDSVYAVFKPYIRISEEYKIKPRAGKGNTKGNASGPNNAKPVNHPSSGKERIADDTAADREGYSGRTPAIGTSGTTGKPEPVLIPFNPNEYTAGDFVELGFSPKQADVIIRFRDSSGGFRSADDFARCYVVSDAMFGMLEEYITIPATGKGSGLLELNTADSLALVSVRGIGARSASDIMAYREKLGGFYDIGQLRDLKVILDKNYELICQQIWVDSCEIQKIDINFATPEKLGSHPYVTDRKLRTILKNRQLKGGWRTIEEMIEDNTLTAREAEKLSPYLQFGPLQP